MSSLQKAPKGHPEDGRCPFGLVKAQSLSLKHHNHRNYRSSKFLRTLIREDPARGCSDKKGSSEAAACEKPELKKYCIARFKLFKEQERPLAKKKNTSVNLFKRGSAQKLKQTLNTEEASSSQALPPARQARTRGLPESQLESQRSFTPKRRFQIIRVTSQNLKVKTALTQENEQCGQADVSFDQALKQQIKGATPKAGQRQRVAKHEEIRTKHEEIRTKQEDKRTKQEDVRTKQEDRRTKQEDIRTKQEDIRTEECLGKVVQKGSLGKKKILVKNPFQRHKKQQALLEQVQQANDDELDQLVRFNESKIVQKLDSSFPSLAHQKQLSELIAMI